MRKCYLCRRINKIRNNYEYHDKDLFEVVFEVCIDFWIDNFFI